MPHLPAIARLQLLLRHPVIRGLAIALLLGGTVRLIPYWVPIRAADLVQHHQAAEFSDRSGLPLGTILTVDQEHTIAVPIDQVSPYFLQAIVAAEDQRFYQRGVVDERAIARALLEAIQARQLISGASTIPMQLARMIDPAPRTLPSKLKQVWTGWRLSAGMNRSDILQAYINRLPMGGNLYGVEAAARTYFGVPASDLTLAQASLLAAIPNAPNRLNPYHAWDRLKKRQSYVLDRMVQDGYISHDQATRAAAEAVTLQSPQQGIQAAPHFLFWLAQQLPQIHPARIQTTIDRPLQQFVETQVQQVIKSLAPHNVHHAAVLVIDNATGEVLAYVGAPDYFGKDPLGRNDGVQALRQPGSTLKPFLYQLALEKNIIQPNTILPDVPTRYAIPGARLYTPSDYSETFQGPVRVRYALANSLNVPAVRVLEKVSVPTFLHRLHQLGFTHLTQTPEYYGLGLTLGSGEVSLWELAQSYLTLARQGDGLPLQVQKSGGQESQSTPVSPSPTWALIREMLADPHARARAFGVDSLLALPFATAVKTGTSSDFRDTWTVGFSRDYTVAVWVGNFDAAPMRKVSGVMGAAPLWHRILLHLHDRREPAAFSPPAGMVKRPICALSGARPTPACAAIVQEYIALEDLPTYDRTPDPFFHLVENSNGKNRYQLRLPSEYNEWLALQNRPVVTNALATTDLRIVSPHHGDYFLLDPAESALTQSVQRLQFKLASVPQRPVEWRLNGKLLQTGKQSLFWTPQPGTWTLEVRDGKERDLVQFEVQPMPARSTRKGFSLGKRDES